MKSRIYPAVIALLLMCTSCASVQVSEPAPYGVLPTEQQILYRLPSHCLSKKASISFNCRSICHSDKEYPRSLYAQIATTAVRVNINSSEACPVLNGFALYMDPGLNEK